MKKGFIQHYFEKKCKNNTGFTLIEILIVLGILAIIISLGTISYSSAQKKARDARRQSDLRTIQNSLEQYYSVCNYRYPMTGTNISPSPFPTSLICTTPTIMVMQTAPLDPLLTPYQVVSADANGTSYTICPPVVRTAGGSYLMETSDCTFVNKTCCVNSQQ